jgi:hypothetical protein
MFINFINFLILNFIKFLLILFNHLNVIIIFMLRVFRIILIFLQINFHFLLKILYLFISFPSRNKFVYCMLFLLLIFQINLDNKYNSSHEIFFNLLKNYSELSPSFNNNTTNSISIKNN